MHLEDLETESEQQAVLPEVAETPKLIQPRDHKAKIILWSDLSVSDMDMVNDAITPDQVRMTLSEIFKLDDYRDNLKTGILVDLYYYTIQFSRDHDFSKEQTSAFFSIVKKTHEVCIETPFGNVDQTFCYFRELVLCHAVKRPPYSIDLFNPDQVRSITEYVVNTYFRHFKMYKYVFTPLVRLDLTMTYAGMPASPEPSEAEEEAGDGEAADGAASMTGGDDGEDGQQKAPPDGEGDGSARSSQHAATETEPEKEESAAAHELRSLVKQHLSEELKKLKIHMDEQLKQSEETLNHKLSTAEASSTGKPKTSAKGRKK